MKNVLKIAIVLALGFNASGQQEAMFTQYMFNGLFLNPAYSGSHKYWTSTLTYRNQWTGADFKGAPQTFTAAVDGPIPGKNMGLGLLFLHDQLGAVQQNTVLASYAYQIKLGETAKLALGLNAGFSAFNSDLTDVLIWDEEDEIYASTLNKVIPKMGIGAYFYAEKYYIGLSIPTLLAYEDGRDFSVDVSKASFLERHYLLTAGYVFKVSENVGLKPSFLLKYVKDAPLQGDINLSAIFKDQFWLGVSYRTGDAVAFLVEYQSNSFFRIGYSYDITTSKLRNYSKGSHEIMIGVDFGRDLKKVKTPRYF